MADKGTASDDRPRKEIPKTFHRTQDHVQIQPSAYRDLLRNRDFLRLWSSQMVSAIGDWLIVAVLLTTINTLSGGKSYAISLLMLAKLLPAVLLGFLAGVFIDRLDRKNTLIICDVARAILVLFLPFMIHHLFIIYVIVFITETFSIIYGPAKDASIPDLVEPEQLTSANSLNLLTLYASMAFGTVIAGAVIGFFTYLGRINPSFFGAHVDPNGAAFFIDSLSFLLSAFFIYRIVGFKRRPKEERPKMTAQQVKSDFRGGFNYLWHERLTRVILILTMACFLGGGTIYVLTVGFVTSVLGASAQAFYYIISTLLFGMMAGSVLAGLLRYRIRKERLLGLAIAFFGAGVIAFSLVTVRWFSFMIVFVGGSSMGYGIVGMVTLLQERLEEEFRGRAFAAIQVVMRASIFASIMVAGPLADLLTALGRRLGFGPISLGIIRFGGSVTVTDGETISFKYLFNGPQIILLIGGVIILFAGLYGQRSFHRYFKWTGHIWEAPEPPSASPVEAQPIEQELFTEALPLPSSDGRDFGLNPLSKPQEKAPEQPEEDAPEGDGN